MQKVLTEKEAEEFLEKEGFSIVKRAAIKRIEEIQQIEKSIPYPWAMKISSSKLAHKAKIGGVILNITNQIKAQETFEKLAKIENFEGVLIQEMVSGEEIIIGLKKTPEFNQVIMFGKGGSKVEEEKDVSFRVLPVNGKEIEEMIKDTQFHKTLVEKQANLKILKKEIIRIASLAKKYPNIIELDLNPLFLTSKEAKIADARMIIEK
jgi:hypothetical protein